jgi:predicted hydrocarbon binding protein
VAPGDPVIEERHGIQSISGRLSVNGARFVLIRPETLAALQKSVEALLADRAGECLAAGGRAGGARAVAAAAHEDAPARAARLMRTGGEIGWGDFALERLTPSALVVTVRNSPFAEAYGAADHPVCHLTRGVLETLAASVLAQPATVVETACAATGAPACRFETRPTAEPA